VAAKKINKKAPSFAGECEVSGDYRSTVLTPARSSCKVVAWLAGQGNITSSFIYCTPMKNISNLVMIDVDGRATGGIEFLCSC
jgi:hypothetical protein